MGTQHLTELLDLEKVIQAMDLLTQVQLKNPKENAYTILAHLNEELGEFCTAICVEDGSDVKGYKKLDESSAEEAVDVIICAFSLLFARGGTIEQFREVANKKLKKWESNL